MSTPQALANPGPYFQHEPVAHFARVSQGVFATYHKRLSEVSSQQYTPLQHAVVAMIYMAEATSVALRLNASWALTTPAMSLCRDRYEQSVRFSWLARTRDIGEWAAYFADAELRRDRIDRSMSNTQRRELGKIVGDTNGGGFARLSPKRRAEVERWSKMPLEQLVLRRDKAAAVGAGTIEREKLGDFYASIYRQFSSVTHADAYSLSMLELHPAPGGGHILTPHPHWPAILLLHGALFDLIQCYEAVAAYFPGDDDEFEALYLSWREGHDKYVGKL